MKRFPNKSIVLNGLYIIVSVAALAGCATQFSYFSPSRDISRVFENGEVLPEYRYYVGGPDHKPNAIVAISKDFSLESEYWSQIDVSSESLKKLVEKIGFVVNAEYKTAIMPNGARITSPSGKEIGVWYSVYQYSLFRVLEGGRVTLSYPQAQTPGNVPVPNRI